jgi:hypothetical protein
LIGRAGGAIALVPVGPVSPDGLAWLAGRLADLLGREVAIGEGLPLPEEGYDPRRRQYRGGAILDALRALPAPGAGRVLGLMPHPERHVAPVQHPRWTRGDAPARGDGLKMFVNAVQYFA